MKKLLYSTAILIAGLNMLPGCSKDPAITQTRITSDNTGSPKAAASDSGIFYLTIYSWSNVPNTGIYTHDVGTLLVSNSASTPPKVQVFLISGNQETSINNPISFMDGSIWTNIDGLHVTIVYRNESGNTNIPFISLAIKIEIE